MKAGPKSRPRARVRKPPAPAGPAALQACPDGAALFDRSGACLFANPAIARLHGFASPAELEGTRWPALLPRAEAERLEKEALPELAKSGAWTGESAGLRRDQTVLPMELSLGALPGGGMVWLSRDVSFRRRLEDERERLLARERAARADAEQLVRARDEFMAVISHELRTPLTAMLGWTLLLREGPMDQARLTHALNIIERNMRMQTQIIEDMLDVSSIVTGKLHLDLLMIDPAPILRAAADDIRPKAEAKQLNLNVELQGGPTWVRADAERLQQVLWNLLSNSVKFTPSGGSISVALRRDATSAEISVSDTGKGISPEFLPFVFDRFRQEESTLTRSHRGLGLGLAIVKHITELHGGEVLAASEGPGRGATFTVRLPLAKP